MNIMREDLIAQIDSARVKAFVIPTTVFGSKVFVKTTKHGLVAQIRNEFREDQKVNLEMHIDEKNDIAIIDTTRTGGKAIGAISLMLQEGAERPPAPRKGRRGRPLGSKNKPKTPVEGASKDPKENVNEPGS